MSPINCVEEDSDISDEEESIGLGASAVEKKEGWLDPKYGVKLPVVEVEDGIFLGQSSGKVVSLQVDEERNASSSDEDSFLGSYPVTGRVETSKEVGFQENGKQNEDDTWYAINQEAEELFHFTGCSSHGDTHKANRGKRCSKITLHSRALYEETPHSARGCGYSSDHEELESGGDSPQKHENGKDHKRTERSVVEVLEYFQQNKKQRVNISKMPVEIETIPLQISYVEHSAVELLDIVQDKTVLSGDLDKYAKNKKRRSLTEKKSAPTLGDRTLNNEDPSELICSMSSSDYEESEPNLKLVVAEATEKTMAERIQEAIGTSILNDHGMHHVPSMPLGLGLFGKLQQVIQAEKEMDANFLVIQQSIENTHEESSWLDVKILSRYLEGKLVVCRCSLTGSRKGLLELDIPETAKENKDCGRILIFNLKICDDVDLDVESCVRVHSPWKEVRTGRHGIIILCSYFSQIKSDDC
ncbi:hypothetical protein QQ045_021810 [Rhodiola kirilowii]